MLLVMMHDQKWDVPLFCLVFYNLRFKFYSIDSFIVTCTLVIIPHLSVFPPVKHCRFCFKRQLFLKQVVVSLSIAVASLSENN